MPQTFLLLNQLLLKANRSSSGPELRFFFAFILLGVCLFWKSAMFQNPESAAEMLFSLMQLGVALAMPRNMPA